MAERIIKSERDTQNRAIDTILSTLPKYRYLGNLADVENSNIREEDLTEFLKRNENFDDRQLAEALRLIKTAAACSNYQNLYDKGLASYKLIRNGENISQGYGKPNRPFHYIDWAHPENNDFAIAEEVTVRRVVEDVKHRRPDIVIYVNGIALVVLELKKMSVSVADAIRQNRRNQEDGEICHFFTTVQLLLAGNESEGIKYAVTKSPEQYWLKWKEPTGEPCEPSQFKQKDFPNEMFRSLLQMLEPHRLLELIHDCIIYDGGIKKVARPNQYFALVAAKKRIEAKENGIIWHSQGSGKSLTMIWLAQWIKEQGNDTRVVIITDRDELDAQIEEGFKATGEVPLRVKSGAKLIDALNKTSPSIICTLIHKFGIGLKERNEHDISIGEKKAEKSAEQYMQLIAESLPEGFCPKGRIVVFVDECHRTQGGILHKAMKKIMGNDVMMIGFTGTPLLKGKKSTTIEQFGTFIHSYKYDEAVRDGVVLDLRYEARNVEQEISDDDKQTIDEIFDQITKHMTPRAKAALRDKWATLQSIESSEDRIKKIVRDVCKDMLLLQPLVQNYGNAMLVAGSIYQAYKFWDCFEGTALRGKTAVVSSYDPKDGVSIQEGHSTDASNDQETFKCQKATQMMGERTAVEFEKWAKEQFIDNPGSMKLLIVVDKLLTGFDAPHATYLYIDKKMEDHNLFQAICRVNRVDNELKEFGYIIDYRDLFDEIKNAVKDYTNGAFSKFDKTDVQGLLKNRLEQGKKDLDAAIETLEGICLYVKQPKTHDEFFDYFVYDQRTTHPDDMEAVTIENANKRELFYNAVIKLVNRYLTIATQMKEAGYTDEQADNINVKVKDYNELRKAIMLRSGDITDLKQYNSTMRQLLDQYVQAPKSKVIEKLDDFSFLDFIDTNKADGVDAIIDGEDEIGGEPAAAETISSNVRKYIVRKHDANPVYYESLSKKLNAILENMRLHNEEYRETLRELIKLARELRDNNRRYPEFFDTDGKKALYDNLGENEELAQKVYEISLENLEQGFRDSGFAGKAKIKKIRNSLKTLDELSDEQIDSIISIFIANAEF